MSGSDLFGWDDSCFSMKYSSDHKLEELVLKDYLQHWEEQKDLEQKYKITKNKIRETSNDR